MKQKCGSIRELLGAFADGELDPSRTEQVKRHLETCADCRRELDQIVGLNRLAKSVEHPRLADDYWDWQRSRVWRGIRERQRAPEPRYRPMFVWPKLAAAAAGFVIVLVVVLAGWRTLLVRPGQEHRAAPVGETPAGLHAAARPEAGTSSGTRKVTGSEVEPAVSPSLVEAEGRPDELAQAPATVGTGPEGVEAGHAARGAGTAVAAKRSAVPTRDAGRRTGVAAEERGEELASVPQKEQSLRVASGRKGRIVSGPVLLESPKLAVADVTDTGTVLLSVKTDSAGRVLSAAVRKTSGSANLDSLAVRQMRQSRFQAAVKNNRNVPSSFEYPFRFQKKQASSEPRQATPEKQVQPKPQEKQVQRDGQKIQKERNVPAKDDRSQKQDSGKQAAPVKEKIKK